MARLDNQRASDGISSDSVFQYNIVSKIDRVIVEVTKHSGYLSVYGKDSILGRIMWKFVQPYSKLTGYTRQGRKAFAKALEERNKELRKEIEVNRMHIRLCRSNNIEIADKTEINEAY